MGQPVEKITSAVSQLGQKGIFESLLQESPVPFFVINDRGICQSTYSKSCKKIFRFPLKGKFLSEVISSDQKEMETWLDVVFRSQTTMTFKELVEMAPQGKIRSRDEHFAIEYHPIEKPAGHRVGMIIFLQDKKHEQIAQKSQTKLEENKEKVIRVLQNRPHFTLFVKQVRSILQLLKNGGGNIEKEFIQRNIHTIKGAAGFFHFNQLQKIINEFEGEISQYNFDEPISRSLEAKIRIYVSLIGENFTSVTNELEEFIGESFQEKKVSRDISLERLNCFAEKVAAQNPELAEHFVQEFIAVPIFNLIQGFSDELQYLSEIFGKKIKPVEFQGDNVKVVREKYEPLAEALIHIFRNVVDHGIESVAERQSYGKHEAGSVGIRVESQRDHLLIAIADDGHGIDPTVIRQRIERYFPEKLATLSEESDTQVLQHIFDPNFSTQDIVTEWSGRGVGLYAAKKAIEELGGTLWVDSEIGIGTTFSIKIPKFS